MRISAHLLVFGMFFSNDVWAAYGILVRAEDQCTDCLSNSTEHSTIISAPFEIPIQGLHPSSGTNPTTETSPPTVPTAITVPPAPTAKSTQDLSVGAKAGIAITVAILCLAIACVFLESCYLRRKRRERALQRAVDEVERGLHKGSEERIVLESRVSIVFDDDGYDDDRSDDADDEDEERGRSRNGMSLPRRV